MTKLEKNKFKLKFGNFSQILLIINGQFYIIAATVMKKGIGLLNNNVFHLNKFSDGGTHKKV